MTPAILDKLPPAVHHGLAVAYADSIQTVFIIAAPIGSSPSSPPCFIPHIELRQGIAALAAGGTPMGSGLDEPEPAAAAARRPQPLPQAADRLRTLRDP